MDAVTPDEPGSTARERIDPRDERILRLPHGEGREALLRAVVKVVATKGLRGLTYRAVAAEAGVTHGLVHYHFGNRETMLRETMRWVVENAVMDIGLVANGEPADELASWLATMSDEDRDAHLFANEFVLAACRSDLREIARPLARTTFDETTEALRCGGIDASSALGRVIFAAINGLTLQHLLLDSPQESREAAAELQRIVRLLRDADSSD